MALTPPPDLEERKKAIKDTHRCPWCDAELTELEAGTSPMGGWGTATVHICLSDECPYYLESARVLEEQGVAGGRYRLAWEPERDWCGPVAAGAAFTPRTGQG